MEAAGTVWGDRMHDGLLAPPALEAGRLLLLGVVTSSGVRLAIVGREQVSRDGGGQALSPVPSCSGPTFCKHTVLSPPRSLRALCVHITRYSLGLGLPLFCELV